MNESQQGCVFTEYLIAFKKQRGKICIAHDNLFKVLIQDSLIESAINNRKKSVNKWLTQKNKLENDIKREVQFVEFDDYIFARLNSKPDTLHYKKIVFEIHQNDRVEIVINFPAVFESRRSINQNDQHQYDFMPRKYLSEQDKVEYATKMLTKVGITCDKLSFTDNDNRTIYFRKNKQILTLLSFEVSLTATVVDPKLLHDAFLNGIGRRKTWGFGMLRIKKLIP